MTESSSYLSGGRQSALLLIADHASNFVPEDVNLGVDLSLLEDHVALDIGAGPLTLSLAKRLDAPAILGSVSRLVVDLHRREDEPSAFPCVSDGHDIPGNRALTKAQKEARLDLHWRPYHRLIQRKVELLRPRVIVSVHSFTPCLASRPEQERPWQIGLLYNRDDRAARLAIGLLRAQGLETGDNQPYSGRELNATMDRHAETRGIPYCVFEIRNDLLRDPEGIAAWTERLAPIIELVRDSLPDDGQSIRTGT